MELRQLKYFVGIAETGRFSDASKALFISQSAVSQQIKALEEELGTQLFVRQPHSVALTESGQELLPLARRVLRGVTDCYERISDLKGMLCGELNIGLTFTLEAYVRDAMLRFLKEYPKVQINAHYRTYRELLKNLRDGEIDIMMSMMPISDHEFCESHHFGDYRLVAVMRDNHPLAKKEKLTFADLQPHSMILPEKGIRDRNIIESYIHKETGQLNIRSLINDASAMMNIIQESNLIGIIAEHAINNRPLLRTVPIEDLSEPIKVYCHFNRDIPRKHAAEVFREILMETCHLTRMKAGMF